MMPYRLHLGDDGLWYAEMADGDVLLGPFDDQEQAEYAAMRFLQHE